MSKFTFIYEGDDGERVEHSNEEYLQDNLREKFDDFLRGCGFSVGEGVDDDDCFLDDIDESEDEDADEEEDDSLPVRSRRRGAVGRY